MLLPTFTVLIKLEHHTMLAWMPLVSKPFFYSHLITPWFQLLSNFKWNRYCLHLMSSMKQTNAVIDKKNWNQYSQDFTASVSVLYSQKLTFLVHTRNLRKNIINVKNSARLNFLCKSHKTQYLEFPLNNVYQIIIMMPIKRSS